jgi:DNA-binding FadR family transcriptional regulator
MPHDASQELNFAILQALHSSNQPMGSWSLYFFLKERGHRVSAPTIGRRLRELEQKNLLGRVTMEGRIITPGGLSMLRQAVHDRHIRGSAEEILRVLKRNRRKDIIDQLTVRRIIEGESASLAAMNASRKAIAKLEGIVQKQKSSITKGDLGVEEDVGFHESLAKASGNQIIVSFVHLLRSQEWMNYALTAIRTKVGTSLVVDHEEIISAMKSRNPAAARIAMQQHISKLIGDVERYWNEAFRRTARSSRPPIERERSLQSPAPAPAP